MSSLKKFLREQCEIQDFDGLRIPAYLPCKLGKGQEWTYIPAKRDLDIDMVGVQYDFNKVIEWNREKLKNESVDGYFIWLRFIPDLVVMDFDNVKGIQEESFKEVKCDENKLKKVLENIYKDFPFLRTKPYTLSPNKGLPHFYLKVRDFPNKIKKTIDICPDSKYEIDILKWDKGCREKMDSEIYNYQEIYKIEDKLGNIYFNDAFSENWDKIKNYFNLEKMGLLEYEKEEKDKKEKKAKIDRRNNTEREIRRVFQEYHNYHLDKTGSVILCSYDEWINFGFMIINELGEEGWELYDEFCAKCNCGKGCYNYNNNRKWFDRALENKRDTKDDNAITIGSYIAKCKSYGIYIKSLKENYEAYTHLDVARLFYDMWCKKNVKYVPDTKSLYIYNEKKALWEEIAESQENSANVMIHLQDKVGIIYDNAFNQLMDDWKSDKNDNKEDIKEIQQKQRKILKMRQKLGDTSYMKSVYYNLKTLIEDSKFLDVINKNADYLPLKNGLVLNLRTGVVSMRTREDYFTFEIDMEYNPHSDFTYVNKYMDSIFKSLDNKDNMEFKKFMQLLFGYFLTGNINHRKIYIFY